MYHLVLAGLRFAETLGEQGLRLLFLSLLLRQGRPTVSAEGSAWFRHGTAVRAKRPLGPLGWQLMSTTHAVTITSFIKRLAVRADYRVRWSPWPCPGCPSLPGRW